MLPEQEEVDQAVLYPGPAPLQCLGSKERMNAKEAGWQNLACYVNTRAGKERDRRQCPAQNAQPAGDKPVVEHRKQQQEEQGSNGQPQQGGRHVDTFHLSPRLAQSLLNDRLSLARGGQGHTGSRSQGGYHSTRHTRLLLNSIIDAAATHIIPNTKVHSKTPLAMRENRGTGDWGPPRRHYRTQRRISTTCGADRAMLTRQEWGIHWQVRHCT